jgi:pantoate--beta-alanine ligase
LEGEHRPTHFDGVATVVAKLFNIAGPCSAFFGEKDFQQVAVIRRLVADLNFPTEIVACPTVRESDGLALSSRNVNLTPQERSVAPSIYQALCVGADRIASGERDVASVEAAMLEVLRAQPLGEVDYVRVIDSLTLQPLNEANDSARLVAAVRFSRARLIDNIGLQSDRVQADRNRTDRLRGTTA